jgi:hypothetical protein
MTWGFVYKIKKHNERHQPELWPIEQESGEQREREKHEKG